MRQLQKHPLYGHTFPNEVRHPPPPPPRPPRAPPGAVPDNCVLGILGRVNFLNFLDALRADAPSPHLAPQVFTLGRAAGPAVMSARAPPSNPLEAVKRGVDDFGAALQRFDRRVKEALRKIPGSKMPGAARGPAPAEGPAAWKKKKKPPAGAPNAKAARPGAPPAEKKKPADDSRVKAYIRHSYANKPAHTVNPPNASSAGNAGGPAPTPTNVNSANSPAAPSAPGGSAGVRGSPQRRPPGPTVKMAAKKAQRVTLADLSEADASVVARARAALAGVDWADARTRTVAGVGACLALFASLRAVSAVRRRGRDGGEGNDGRDSNLDTADIDSAYASPQLTPRGKEAPGGKKAKRGVLEDANAASAAPSAASSARRLFFGLAEASHATGSDEGKDGSAAREKPPSVPEEAASVPTKSSSTRSRLGGAFGGGGFPVGKRASIRHRLGFGSDAFARAVHAKTAVIKATKRLKRAGDLRVSVIDVELIDGFAAEVERARDARLEEAAAAAAAAAARGETDERGSRLASSNARSTKNSTRFAMKFRVDVDVPAGHPARGACTAPERLNRRKDFVGFNSRMAFALPADGSGHEGREIKVRLCDASGRCVAKAGLGLRATLRAAPVTKAFPIFDRGGEKVGSARLAFEWAYEKKAA